MRIRKCHLGLRRHRGEQQMWQMFNFERTIALNKGQGVVETPATTLFCAESQANYRNEK